MIKRLEPELFKDELFQSSNQTLKRYSIYKLYRMGCIAGYNTLKKLGKPNEGKYDAALMIKPIEDSYLDLNFSRGKGTYWILTTKEAIDVTNAMIKNSKNRNTGL